MPSRAAAGRGVLRQPRVLCPCEGVGRVPWGGSEDTGRTASLGRGASPEPGHLSGRGYPRGGRRSRKEGQSERQNFSETSWEEQGGEGESEPEREHICEVVGRGESWPERAVILCRRIGRERPPEEESRETVGTKRGVNTWNWVMREGAGWEQWE